MYRKRFTYLAGQCRSATTVVVHPARCAGPTMLARMLCNAFNAGRNCWFDRFAARVEYAEDVPLGPTRKTSPRSRMSSEPLCEPGIERNFETVLRLLVVSSAVSRFRPTFVLERCLRFRNVCFLKLGRELNAALEALAATPERLLYRSALLVFCWRS